MKRKLPFALTVFLIVLASGYRSALCIDFTGSEFAICTDPNDQSYPDISGNIVVWTDDRSGNEDIYGYDLSTQTEFSICTDPNDQSHPAVSGNIVVWRDNRNGNYDIYGYDISTQTEFEIFTHHTPQYYPDISGNIVVWSDNRNDNCINWFRVSLFECDQEWN